MLLGLLAVLAAFAPAIAAGVLLSKACAVVALPWRSQFALGALPAISLLSVAAFWMPESPLWLRARRGAGVTAKVGDSGPPHAPAAALPREGAAEVLPPPRDPT